MGVDPKVGRFPICPKASRFVPVCPLLSRFVTAVGPKRGKRGQTGTFLETPPSLSAENSLINLVRRCLLN